jgi:hypothetical protein
MFMPLDESLHVVAAFQELLNANAVVLYKVLSQF